jgi:methionyl aminopeptidase
MPGQIKSPQEIETIAEGGKLLRDILLRTAKLVKPGVTTLELSNFADAEIRTAGGVPSFIGYGDKDNPFPAALCTSVNDVVVHGIPNAEKLMEGDIVGLDIGMKYKGLFTDTAITVPVGRISEKQQRLISITKQSMELGIAQAQVGNRIGDIGYAVQKFAEKNGYGVVRDLVGHGVGYDVHEDPQVPNYGKPGTGAKLVEGMVIAIEPMLCTGTYHIYFDDDGWTIRTEDGGLSAHFEHTVAVTKNGPRLLT